jgi:hypothetical protein
VSYAISCGIPMLVAVSIYSVEGLAGLGGRIAFGLLGDRFGAKRCLDKRSPAREKRQPYSHEAIQPCLSCVWPPCGRQPAIHPIGPVNIAQVRAAKSRHRVIQVPCAGQHL